MREYQQRMTESGQKEFDFSSLEGFLAAKVLTEGLRTRWPWLEPREFDHRLGVAEGLQHGRLHHQLQRQVARRLKLFRPDHHWAWWQVYSLKPIQTGQMCQTA